MHLEIKIKSLWFNYGFKLVFKCILNGVIVLLRIIHGVYTSSNNQLHIDDISNQFIKAKFQAEHDGAMVFSALVDEDFTKTQIKLEHGLIRLSEKRNCARTTHNKSKSLIGERSLNSLKKQIRKDNNRVMSAKNWKQFIGSKGSVISSVSHFL